MTAIWRNHSLTIVLGLIGSALTVLAMAAFEDGRWLDLVLGLGQSTLGVALFYFLSVHFREVAKPEDPPHAEV
jgi:hypothetical protein